MRGITKIQLIDPITGEVRQEFEEENLITTAINDAINIALEGGGEYIKSSNLSAGLLPFTQSELVEMFHEVLLLEDSQNVGDLMAKGKVIGVASDSEVVKSTYDTTKDGLYLPLESGEISGGYKIVWQWGTTQGNGNINSICLKPNRIHNLQGLSFDVSSTPKYFGNLSSLPTKCTPLIDSSGNLYTVNSAQQLVKYTKKARLLSDALSYVLSTAFDSTILNSTDLTDANEGAVREYGGYLYVLDVVSSVAYLRKFNKSTGVLISSVTLGVGSTLFQGFDINANYIIYCSALDEGTDEATVQVYNLSGVHQRTITVGAMPRNDMVKLFFLNSSDEFYIISSNYTTSSVQAGYYGNARVDASDGSIHYVMINLGMSVYYKQIIADICNSDIKATTWFMTPSSSVKPVIFSANPMMLSTINNLGSQIVKTSADVLKISYSLFYT